MSNNPTPYEALILAIESAGSQTALARKCGLSVTAVWKWVQSSKRASASYVLRIEAATGVSRHALRPDIYPVEDRESSARWLGLDKSSTQQSAQL